MFFVLYVYIGHCSVSKGGGWGDVSARRGYIRDDYDDDDVDDDDDVSAAGALFAWACDCTEDAIIVVVVVGLFSRFDDDDATNVG